MPPKPQPRYQPRPQRELDPDLDLELQSDSQIEPQSEAQPESRRAERISLGAYLGLFAVLGPALLTAVLPLCSAKFSWDMWSWVLWLVAIAIVPGGAAGAIGAAVASSRRAVLYGAIIFACGAIESVWLADLLDQSLRAKLWIVAAASAFGALTAGAGAVLGRTIPWEGDGTEPLSLSWRELLVAVLLIAVLAGYLRQVIFT